MSVRLASIWAQDRTRILGSGTGMLWRVPEDFKHFKASTMGCPIIMGRRSWEALGGALPGRTNIVVTSNREYEAEGALAVASLDEALSLARSTAAQSGAQTIWITGGAQLYEQTMSLVDELVVTRLDLDLATTLAPQEVVRAPIIDETVWMIDPSRSDADWQPLSGDCKWRVDYWVKRSDRFI
ncbi:dihydrofolate reductase [Schaalia vaccimaxillae]|uniref:dihydrofolate reductase n=1 Tax=Schaalia vaccimaxillae TaxID=183916 RepID=UPI0003B5BDA0|nr:dihydrofolate reductase [Schaalia vaccimaxillae]